MGNKVKVNSKYIYNSVHMDRFSPANQGLKEGDIVQVVNLPGCPKANIMGQCHVKRDGKFMGMVSINSLEKIKKG